METLLSIQLVLVQMLFQMLLFQMSHAHSLISAIVSSEEATASRSQTTPPTLDPALAHHALVVYNRNFCSGSFISSKIVLTVASCFHQDTKHYDIFVKYGCKNFMDGEQFVAVVEKKEHEYFQYKSELDNDVALLVLKLGYASGWNSDRHMIRLSQNSDEYLLCLCTKTNKNTHIQFDNGEKKVVLIEPGKLVPVHSFIVVTGWGKDVTKSQENSILQSEMQVIDRDECLDTFPDVVTDSIFCAKYDLANRLSDNGGAALYKGSVVGISSYGANLEETPHIALFTNVSYFHKWIKLNTERLLSKHCSNEFDDVWYLLLNS